MHKFSVVTIVKERRKQLSNLLDSIMSSTIIPNDIQIIFMDNPNGISTHACLNVKIHHLQNEHSLPLAAARNMGIRASETENIIFIDVDCIISPTLFHNLLYVLQPNKIVVAYPLYLTSVPDKADFNELKKNAVPHPAREYIPFGEPVPHLQFWSLIFAIRKEAFEKIGGFDESFAGYGAEDTDFAMKFHKIGIEHVFVKDHILHQYHPKYNPPLNYFDSIIMNAQRYKQKWNVLPMQSWLTAFEAMGFIKIDKFDDIMIIDRPTEDQIKNSISSLPY